MTIQELETNQDVEIDYFPGNARAKSCSNIHPQELRVRIISHKGQKMKRASKKTYSFHSNKVIIQTPTNSNFEQLRVNSYDINSLSLNTV